MAQPLWAKEHVERYRETAGAEGHIWTGFDGKGNFPCLLLTTKGRVSGKAQTTPLIYGEDKGALIVIASQGGRPEHPKWYLNLQAHPDVEVQVKSDVFSAAAHTVVSAERGRLWEMMAEIYPPYNDYREKAINHREIPVVILTHR